MSLVDVQFLGSGDAFGSGGRFNTCFHVLGQKNSFLIDCGASSLIAMRKFNVDPDSIEAIFLTHLHGDHFAGVVFFLMDARYVSKRTRPLIIAGPKGVKERVIQAMDALYPGCWDKGIDFEILFIELKQGHAQTLNGIKVQAFQARHLQDENDFILRFEVEGKTIVYSGDTGWTESLVSAAQSSDLFICECYLMGQQCEFHMDYETIAEQKHRFNTRNLVLTHLGADALAQKKNMDAQVAFDGLIISV
jgi:ribonuclease BN (tRNA processing enzyme)